MMKGIIFLLLALASFQLKAQIFNQNTTSKPAYEYRVGSGWLFLPIEISIDQSQYGTMSIADLKASIFRFVDTMRYKSLVARGNHGKYKERNSYLNFNIDIGSIQVTQFLREAGVFNAIGFELIGAKVAWRKEVNEKVVLGVNVYAGFGFSRRAEDKSRDIFIDDYNNYIRQYCHDCDLDSYSSGLDSRQGIDIVFKYRRFKATMFAQNYYHNFYEYFHKASTVVGEEVQSFDVDFSQTNHQTLVGLRLDYDILKKASYGSSIYVKASYGEVFSGMTIKDYNPNFEQRYQSSKFERRHTVMPFVSAGVRINLNVLKSKKKK